MKTSPSAPTRGVLLVSYRRQTGGSYGLHWLDMHSGKRIAEVFDQAFRSQQRQVGQAHANETIGILGEKLRGRLVRENAAEYGLVVSILSREAQDAV